MSKKPKPIGVNPWLLCALSPGPLGINDAASPLTPDWFVGDTPGSLGCNDHADPKLIDKQHLLDVRLRRHPVLAPEPDLSNVKRAMRVEYDHRFDTGAHAESLKDNITWAAKLTELNPGFLAAVLLSEKDKPWVYVCPEGTVLHDVDCAEPTKPGVCTYTVGTDTYATEKGRIDAVVPAAAQVKFESMTGATHLNDARSPKNVTNKHFASGRDAVLGVAVYLKYGEQLVRRKLPLFSAQPLAVQWGLTRLAMNPGIGHAESRINKVKHGRDIFVHGTIERDASKADSAMTRLVAIAFHLSSTVFGIEP